MGKLNYGFNIHTAQYERSAHPDALGNSTAQKLLQAHLLRDQNSRGDMHALFGDKFIYVGGQVRTSAPLSHRQIEEIVVNEVISVGYRSESGYGLGKRRIIIDITPQSMNIAHAVRNGGAGDTITKLGYATKETPELLPLEHILVRDLTLRLDEAYRKQEIGGLGPDGKLNIAVDYEHGLPYVRYIVIAAQHNPQSDLDKFRTEIEQKVVLPVLGKFYVPGKTRVIINGAGRFEYAGPVIDRGVKGKKDTSFTYGDKIGHTGGSAFGKDATKVDFHGLVWARYVTKNLVANRVADEVLVKVTHVIGQEGPLVIDFAAKGSVLNKKDIDDLVKRSFPLARVDVLSELDLRQPWIFPETARVGFFGNREFPWERLINLR